MTNFTLIAYQEASQGYTDRWGDFRDGKPSHLDIFYETDAEKVGAAWAEKEEELTSNGGEGPEFTLLMDGVNIDDIDDELLNEMFDTILATKADRAITLREEKFAAAQLRIEKQRLKDEKEAAEQKKHEDEISRQMYEVLKKKYGANK